MRRIGVRMQLAAATALASVVVAAVLLTVSRANAESSLPTPFAGNWSTSYPESGGTGSLSLQATDATSGLAALHALNPEASCTNTPTVYYVGSYTAGSDSGKVAGCTIDAQGEQLAASYGGGPNGFHGNFTIRTYCSDPNSFGGEYYEATNKSTGHYNGTRSGPSQPPCNGSPASPTPASPLAATVKAFSGQVEYQTPGGSWHRLLPGEQVLPPGYAVHTGLKASLTLVIRGATLTLKPQSLLIIGEATGANASMLVIGEVSAEVKHKEGGKSDFEVKTATTTAGVRGTIFSVSARHGSTTIKVTRGAVKVTPTNHKLKAVLVRAGQQVTVTNAKISRVTRTRGH